MGTAEIIHAWKDSDYLASLGDSSSELPPNPAGLISAPPVARKATEAFVLTFPFFACSRPECSNTVDCPPPANIRE
jgi:mersacidin/lichenicidin family type 2 lantibiotic